MTNLCIIYFALLSPVKNNLPLTATVPFGAVTFAPDNGDGNCIALIPTRGPAKCTQQSSEQCAFVNRTHRQIIHDAPLAGIEIINLHTVKVLTAALKCAWQVVKVAL